VFQHQHKQDAQSGYFLFHSRHNDTPKLVNLIVSDHKELIFAGQATDNLPPYRI
jgi:hypothetical protein